MPAETEIEQQKPDDITVPAIIPTDNIDDVLDSHYAENYQFHRSRMPNIITQYASNISMQKGQPFELIAPGLLAVMSGAMGTKHKIQLDESWQQPPIIWMINLAPEGNRLTFLQNRKVVASHTS